jgi:hypothetical protein
MMRGQTPQMSHGTGRATESSARLLPDAIRQELDRVLASHEFRSSKRCQDFLRYVVEATLQGRADHLKERTIGADVFGRSASYDPSDDATVRVKAGEVRKRLSMYYAGEGAADEVRIELPGGTYVPEFRAADRRPPVAEATTAGLPESAPIVLHPGAPSARMRFLAEMPVALIAIVLVAAAAAAGLFLLFRAPPANAALDRFWAPVLRGSSPLWLCASFVPVWGLRDPTATVAAQREDFVQLTDQFVGGGDMAAIAELASMLTARRRAYHVRIGGQVSFEDLRAGPAIMVGYSYTRWREISSRMRYFIDATHAPLGITDNGVPTKWMLPDLPADRRTKEDYAIVSRVFHPDTRAMLVELAGITQYGTIAASDLVTSADLLAEALRNAPPGWQNKNLQLVLHVNVISGVPASPKVIATYFW